MEKKDLQRHRARLSGYEETDGTFRGLDLRNAVAQRSAWKNCTFESVRFSLAALGDALFDSCTFIRCDFRQATLVSRIHGSRFESCDFDQADFSAAWITETTFSRCRAQLSNWERATLAKVRLDCDLRGANFNPAFTDGVDFTGANLWSARMPLNCASVFGNTFDERQIGAFLALLEMATLPPGLAKKIGGIVPKASRALVKRLFRATMS